MSRVYGLLMLLLPLLGSAQSYDYSIGQQMEKIDSVREWLLEYEQLGYKSIGTTELENARDWIMDKYESYGYSPSLDSFKFSGLELQNLIIEKPGLIPNHWIVLTAHYDSYNQSPGANDNGSGLVACIQIAKIMKDIDCEVGIRIVHFSAEESGLVGSTHYVANSLSKLDQLELVLNLDQLGGTKGADNSKITCERDEHMNPATNNAASALKTDTLAQLARTYSFLEPEFGPAFSSDYMPFQDSGYVITGLYQESNYPFYHSSNDLVANMDLDATEQVIRVALAASMYFARNTLPLSTPKYSNASLEVYPNPASQSIQLRQMNFSAMTYAIFNTQGQLIQDGELSPDGQIDLSQIGAGVHQLRLVDEQAGTIQHTRLIIAR